MTFLTSGEDLPYHREGADLVASLPEQPPDPIVPVIKLECSGPVSADPLRCLMPGMPNVFEPFTAKLAGKSIMKKQSWMQEFGNWKHQQRIEGWEDAADAAEWSVRVVAPGSYRVSVTYSRAGKSGRQGRIDFGGQTLWFEAQNTGVEPRHEFKHVVGVMPLTKAGRHTLRLSPGEAGDEWLSLKEVRIEPFDAPATEDQRGGPIGQTSASGVPIESGQL